MAKMTRTQVEEIVAKELPGYRVVGNAARNVDSTRMRKQPEASSPEIEELFRKFNLDDDDAESGFARDGVSNGGTLDDEIALVEKTDPVDPLSRGNRPKAKVLTPRGTVKGSQG